MPHKLADGCAGEQLGAWQHAYTQASGVSLQARWMQGIAAAEFGQAVGEHAWQVGGAAASVAAAYAAAGIHWELLTHHLAMIICTRCKRRPRAA